MLKQEVYLFNKNLYYDIFATSLLNNKDLTNTAEYFGNNCFKNNVPLMALRKDDILH